MRAFTVIALAAVALPSAPAAAQSSSDVVVMRRSVAPPKAKATASVPLTPGARRRCDMPVNGMTVTAPTAITFSDTRSSVAAAHALCETTSYAVTVCTVGQYGGKNSSTYIVKGFSPGGLGPTATGEEFVGAGVCRPL